MALPVEPAALTVELFCPPSAEAVRLRRWLGPLTAPAPGEDSAGWRGVRHLLVAPFTQLTFLSFDLQMFLFDVFHTSPAARVGHGVGMTGVTLFGLALVAAASPGASVAAAGLLLAWYAVVAASVRLPRWWAVMLLVVAGLLALAGFLAASVPLGWLVVGCLGSGAVISVSHAFEPYFPPRAGDPLRWLLLREYILGPADRRHPAPRTLGRLARVAGYALVGWVNELWAAPRLLPYNVLRLLLAAGYAPDLAAVLDDRARRAWASGNPALDFVGIGGGAFLPRAGE